MTSFNLIRWDKLRTEIEQAKDIQELSAMSNKLEAIRIMAKQSKASLEVQNKIAEYRLRVERKKGEWLKENIQHDGAKGIGVSTESTHLKDIGITRDESSKSQRIANLDEKQFEEYIQETKETNKEVTLAGVVKLAKQIIREDKIEEQKEILKKEVLEQPKGKFDVIVIDPPWKYSNKYNPEGNRGTTPYPQIPQNELLKIQLPAKDDCILWLWTTNAFMKDAYELLEEWGFASKTILTWNKVNIGVGRWLRNVTEHCILSVKGSPVWDNKTYSTLITEKRTEHSKKPKTFYDMVNKICYGRKLDYFARQKRKGWEVYGDEVK